MADKPTIQVFLPPYSPNRTLIERLRKYLRQKIINPIFYRTKGQFKTAVLGFFDRLDECKQDLASLLTPKYHTTHDPLRYGDIRRVSLIIDFLFIQNGFLS